MAENEEKNKTVKENKEEPKKDTAKKEEVKAEVKKDEPKKEAVKKAPEKPVEEKKFEQPKTTETKKATTAKATKEPAKPTEKKKNIAVRAVAVVVILLLVVALIYMALPSPARALQQMLTNLKAGNFEKVEEFVDYDELMGDSIVSPDDQEQAKLLLKNFQFAVKNVSQKGDVATIELETTNINFEVIVRNAATKLLQKYFNSEDAEIESILIEELQKEDIETVTTTQKITVKKQDGKWKVEADDSLRNAIFPGLMETLETLTSGTF